ncbi:phosphatase PAP2 family protein [Actinomyces sp. B33]|uniref:phosphatase PAP2 family protein n=1 Tax=Actinomyces sp. B33 TaxID=2942131 RepID=UPI002340779B|nr:phosphatase PAP2 family protein [Actinomyces sp. B33]MDC4233409.1 phosphatase PAP2 family protein [Actinomyces sp. B33]
MPRGGAGPVDRGWYRRRLVRRLLGALACVVAGAALTVLALSTRWGQGADTVVMESMMLWASRLGGAGELLTSVVSVPAIAVVGAGVGLIALLRRRPTLAGRALGMVVGANATTQALKALLDRPDLGVTTGAGNSLPSGHVCVAVTISLALVVIAPEWLRGPAAWAGWAWASLMGMSVMMSAWHRLSDVLVAALVAGAWALALTPIERRPRHSAALHRARLVIVVACGLLALVVSAACLVGVDLSEAAAPGVSGYGFADFLAGQAWRGRLLSAAGALWVVAVVGFVVHEVDGLCSE